MKIALINGQNHKGSTYHIGRMLADKLGGEVTEFFLPRDFGEFCCGCDECSDEADEADKAEDAEKSEEKAAKKEATK